MVVVNLPLLRITSTLRKEYMFSLSVSVEKDILKRQEIRNSLKYLKRSFDLKRTKILSTLHW